jgi:phosphate starvation-inducible PhoH-like protein
MSALSTKKMKKTSNSISTSCASNTKKSVYLDNITPMTESQSLAFDAFKRGENLVFTGSAGTGKTFISMYLSLRAIINNLTDHKKLIIVRSAVSTRDLGALPGDLAEKTGIYELPYYAICNEITGNKNAYSSLKSDGIISYVPTSFLRGVTFNDCIVFLDEGQNCNFHELYTVVTRSGQNCQFVFSGDIRQNDLYKKQNDQSGFGQFIKVINDIPSFTQVDFNHDDIVRGPVCKEFIIATEKHGY